MVEAILYDKLSGNRVRCNICQWRCIINPGKAGVCGVRLNRDGILIPLNYARVSSVAADPVEKKPLFHFFPGTDVLSFGTVGCNFHCMHCQNWQIACIDDPKSAQNGLDIIMPEEAVNMAKVRRCAGLAWTYNEPTIWFEYTLDSARLAHKAGLYTVYVTNGFMTPEALDVIGPYLDAWRVDIKGFSDKTYSYLAKIGKWREILEVAERARHKWKMHLEVVTNVIPGLNDDDKELRDIAMWIKVGLGELIPWHVTRFYPHHNLSHLPPTPVATLERAYNIGKSEGLKFVYLGNVPGHSYENTVCYNCGRLVIERSGYSVRIKALNGTMCANCGANLNIVSSLNAGVRK